MLNATIKMICIQVLMAAFFLLAFAGSTFAQDGGDAQALERLKWMRQNQGDFWNVNAEEGAFCAVWRKRSMPARRSKSAPRTAILRFGSGWACAGKAAVNCGRVDIARLRRALACLPLPAWPDGRIRLAADVSNWLRPDAATSPERLFCHCCARGRGNAQMIPGWPYSVIAALEPGRTSWALPLDAVRLGPADDATAVTAGQVREVVTRQRPGQQRGEGLLIDPACGQRVIQRAVTAAELRHQRQLDQRGYRVIGAQDRIAQIGQRICPRGQAPVQPGTELPQRHVPVNRACHLGGIQGGRRHGRAAARRAAL